MYSDLVILQSQLQGPTMAFNNMIGQMNSQRIAGGIPMSTYNPYAAEAIRNQQQYLMMQAQNRLMGLTNPRPTNVADNQIIELD